MSPFAIEGAAGLCPLVPVGFSSRWPGYDESADLAVAEVAPVIINEPHVITRHRPAGGSIADVAWSIAEEGLQHLGRSDPVENVDAGDRPPAFAEMLGQRL